MSQVDTKIISIINMKGGVSKTTLCKEVGFHLSHVQKKKVLLVDIDPQANLTQSMFRKFGYKAKGEIKTQTNSKFTETDKSISYLFANGKTKKFNKEKVTLELTENLDLIPGTLGTDFISRKINSSEMEQSLYNYFYFNDKSGFGEYDYIILDCPPTYSEYTVAGILPSHYYLIPVHPDSYSILGIQMLQNVINHIETSNQAFFQTKKLKSLGVVFTKIQRQPQKGVIDVIDEIKNSEKLASLGIEFLDTMFRVNSKLNKELDYLIDLGSSTFSKRNLETLVAEIEGKM